MTRLYDDPPMDEEEIGTSLVPIESIIPIPIDVDRSIKEWQDYQRLCREILDDEDYVQIKDKRARKRSGWAKLRRFYHISTRVLIEDRMPPLEEWAPGEPFVYRFLVEGRLGNRVEHGDGACESTELEGGNIAPTEHNVRAKALTRAKNRVTSDLIGGGEVSAEELENGAPSKPAPKPQAKHWIEYEGARKKFWVWAREDLSLTDEQVHEALGVESVKDYEGTMAEAKKQIEEWIEAQMEEQAE